MKILKYFFRVTFGALMVFTELATASPIATPAPISFALSVSSTSMLPGSNFGSVQLTQNGQAEVDFTVSLATGYAFAKTGSIKNAFAFNIGGGNGFMVDLTGTSSSSGTYVVSSAPIDKNTRGFGQFSNGINFTGTAGGGMSGQYTAPITFKVTNSSGVSYADFENLNSAGYLFAADIGNIASGATGSVGSGQNARTPDGNPSTPVPEPTTVALLGLGLMGLVITRRRKV